MRNILLTGIIFVITSCSNQEKKSYFHGYNKDSNNTKTYHTLEITDSLVFYNKGKFSYDLEIIENNTKSFIEWFDKSYSSYSIVQDTIFIYDDDSSIDYWVRKDLNYENFIKDLSSLNYIDLTPKKKQKGYELLNLIYNDSKNEIIFINVGYPKHSLINKKSSFEIQDLNFDFKNMTLFADSLYLHNLATFITLDRLNRRTVDINSDYILVVNDGANVPDKVFINTIIKKMTHKPAKIYRTCVNGKDMKVFAYELKQDQ